MPSSLYNQEISKAILQFLKNIVGVPIEEASYLLIDQLKFQRYKNQIKILQKAERFIKRKGITTKAIPIKILAPFLEQSSLEDDEFFQEKWANLLVNMVDSELNFQSNVFPYILNQISKEEYIELEELIRLEKNHKIDVDKFDSISNRKNSIDTSESMNLSEKIKQTEQDGFSLSLKDFECANLIRLGLVRRTPPLIFINEFIADVGDIIHPYQGINNETQLRVSDLQAEYITPYFGYRITELGEKVIQLSSLDS